MKSSFLNLLKRLLANPTLNGWGFILGIVGLLFAWYTYSESKSEPLLLAQLNVVRTIVVSPEGIENLQVLADGKPIGGPITAAQIAIWNAGKRPIREDDVLDPIRISIDGERSIIAARVLRVTRDITRVRLDESRKAAGELGIRFRILEEGDGAILQVTYLGNDKVPIVGRAVIVGQNNFEITTRFAQSQEEEKSHDLFPRTRWQKILASMLFGLLSVILVFNILKACRAAYTGIRSRSNTFRNVFSFAAVLLLGGLATWIIYLFVSAIWTPAPPFPF